jgi:hypothetical protein
VRYAICSVSTEHTEQQSNRATEHSAGHVTHRSAVLAAGRDERRRIRTHCLGHHYTHVKVTVIVCRNLVARFARQNGLEDTLNTCNRLSRSRFRAVHLPSSATAHRGIPYGGHVSR